MRTITVFDTTRHHIYLRCRLLTSNYESLGFVGILDTGASKTELSTLFLISAKILKVEQMKPRNIRTHQETQKIGKIVLPTVEICGQTLSNFEIFVSQFDSSWGGIDALIGLDFFRYFRVTIDYSKGEILTEKFIDKTR